jgi:hypothetical protein
MKNEQDDTFVRTIDDRRVAVEIGQQGIKASRHQGLELTSPLNRSNKLPITGVLVFLGKLITGGCSMDG